MAWRMAESLEVLRKQLNDAFPKRSKVSDGGIGDAKHASRSSDHNPWVKDSKGKGVVTARDFTHDPKTGIDCQWLADSLVKSKDPRIKYIIWNKQICSSTKAWEWRQYKGINGHTHHLHLSVNADPKHYDSTRQWKLDFPKEKVDDIARVQTLSAAVPQEATPKSAIVEPSDTLQPDFTEGERPTESKVTQEKGGTTVEISEKNEQDVNTPAKVTSPEPYQGIGFWPVIKRDLGAAFGGNLTMQGFSEYAAKASGWPDWVVALIGKFALVVLAFTGAYFIFRVVHFVWDGWKKNQKTKMEADAATSTVRKDIEWQ